MTLKKLVELAAILEAEKYALHGVQIYAHGNGELVLELSSQPSNLLHATLKRKGFVLIGTDYHYRPPIKVKP